MLRKLPNKQGATRSHIGPLSKDRLGPSDDDDDDDDDEMHRGSGAVFAPAADGLTAIHRRHRLYRRRPAVELRTTNRGDVRSHGDQLVVNFFVFPSNKPHVAGGRIIDGGKTFE